MIELNRSINKYNNAHGKVETATCSHTNKWKSTLQADKMKKLKKTREKKY